ncbi:MAG: MBL fold metallo-hydrolase [Acidobacteriota bacterium]
MRQTKFLAKFYGVRGSHPASGSGIDGFGGNTTCLHVEAGGHRIIVDAGTGIINLGQELVKNNGGRPVVATLLFTHAHIDHTQGFPFFAPAYRGTSVINVLGPMAFQQTLEEAIRSSMLPPFSPVALHEMPCHMTIQNIFESNYLVLRPGDREPRIENQYKPGILARRNDVRIGILHSYAHPKGGVLVFRVEHAGRSVVFATDVEGYVGGDQRLISFSRGADFLIHDAQYEIEEYLSPARPTQGWGHSTWEMAAEVAQQAGVKHLLLTHHDPFHDDRQIERIEAKARKQFARTTAAREGMVLDLSAGTIRHS